MRFLDSTKIYVKSGRGGDGCSSFRREKYVEFGGPNGGDGGYGGNVYIRTNASLNTLIDFRYQQHFKAQNGFHGQGRNKHGSNGQHVIIDVPINTVVYNHDKSYKLVELNKPNQQYLLLNGGRGGLGNLHFKSSINRAPRYTTKGELGAEAWIWLELELLADIGLIGLPNAGKSTIICNLTNSKSKIGAYSFTTLYPNLGVFSYHNQSLIIADLPGLISGANKGIGLGARFLSHIKKCKILVHIIDITALDIRDSYNTIINELAIYDQALQGKHSLVILNKTDMLSKKQLKEKIEQITQVTNNEIITLSALSNKSLDKLRQAIIKICLNNEEDPIKKWSPLEGTIN